MFGSDKPTIQDIFKLNYFEFSKKEANADILDAFKIDKGTTTTTSSDISALKMLKIAGEDKEIIKRNFDNGNNAFIVKIYNN